jgi:4-hydroxy-tetrahydrodipicolinate synthase
MELNRFRGTAVALVTPFKVDGAVDEEALARHVEWCINGGVEVVVPCGTTGESATMSPDEQRQVIALTAEAAEGRAAVLAGAGGNNTADVVERAEAARRAGADAILSVSPYYNKPTPDGLYGHYSAVAEAAELPVIVYNVPGRTASNITAQTLLRLAEIDGVVGVKEASGDIEQIQAIIRERPDDFLVLSGDDALTLAVLALGGDGVVSVVANEAPDRMSEMVRAALSGDLGRARELHFGLLPLMQANFVETSPIPVKTALEMMGRGPAYFRLPLVSISPSGGERVREALERVGLL